MAHVGESFIEFYKEKSCINQLQQDSNGDFILDIGAITDNALSPLTFPIWCKNIGTNNAYDVSAIIIESSIPVTLISTINSIRPSQVSSLLISLNIPIGFTENINIKLKVGYSNV